MLISGSRAGSLHRSLPPATLERGHPDSRHPRFRIAVYAADRAAHPRTECFFRGAALHGAAQRNSSLQTDRIDSFRRAFVGVRRRRAGCRPARAGAWACRRSAFAMGCTSSCITWAARCARRRSASTATPKWTIEDSATPLFAGLPPTIQVVDEPRRRG